MLSGEADTSEKAWQIPLIVGDYLGGRTFDKFAKATEEEIKNISMLYDDFSEINVDLQYALEQLPKNQRNVIILKFMHMMPDKQIMEKLKLSRQSVYKNKIKGLEKLKEILKDL